MKIRSGRIKGTAKALLAGNGHKCALSVAAQLAVYIAFSNIVFLVGSVFSVPGVAAAFSPYPEALYSSVRLASVLFALILSVFVMGAFSGAAAWYWRRAEREYAPSALFFRGFNVFFRAGILWLLLKILHFLSFAAFALPSAAFFAGFYYCVVSDLSVYIAVVFALAGAVSLVAALIFSGIFMQKFALAMYFLTENPLMGAVGAMRESAARMAGYEKRLFFFKLGFIPWFLSCILILPIFYVAPYYMQSCACFGRCVMMGMGSARRSAIIIGKPIAQ